MAAAESVPQAEASKEPNLRVTHLIVRDYKRIESIDIQPGDKTLVLLTGENEQGKTSAIDALAAALGGKSLSPDVPVRRGAEDAEVDIRVSDKDGRERYRVVRDWSGEDNTSLKVYRMPCEGEKDDPERLAGPQGVLDDLISSISFNPLAFMQAKKEDYLELLLSAVGLQQEYERCQRRKAAVADERKELNRKLADNKVKLKGRPLLTENPAVKIGLEEVEKRLEKINKHNTDRAGMVDQRLGLDDEAQRLQENYSKLQNELNESIRMVEETIKEMQALVASKREDLTRLDADVKAEMAGIVKAGNDLDERIKAHGPGKDATAIKNELAEIETHNAKADEDTETKRLTDEAKDLEDQIRGLNIKLENNDANVLELLEASPIGKNVPGLVVKDGEVFHNDVPLSQASGMRKLELSALIGMASNQRLRIMCLDEMDKLDDKSLNRLVEMAKERGYQLWGTAVRVTAKGDDYCIVPVAKGRRVDVRA